MIAAEQEQPDQPGGVERNDQRIMRAAEFAAAGSQLPPRIALRPD
jgi:hypothetical protein